MGAQSKEVGNNSYVANTSDGSGADFTSKFVANTFYSSPVTGAIGSSVKPILITNTSINIVSGASSVEAQFATSAGGGGGVQGNGGASVGTDFAAFADTTYYYGFQKQDGTYVEFYRGDGTNPNTIYLNGTSYNPATTAPLTWPQTSINGTINWSHVPTAPRNFVSTGKTNSSITLDWDAPLDEGGSGVNNYRVLYKVRNTATDSDPNSWSVKVIGGSGSTTSTTVTGLSANTTYDFRVAAMNGVSDAHNATYTSASAHTGANASLNSITTDNVEITGFSMPFGIVNKFYSGSVSASGSATFSVTSGSLPTGLSLGSSSGQVTGTPTTAGTYNFTISVSSGGVVSDSQAFTVVIYHGGPKVITGTGPTATTRSSLKVRVSGAWVDGYMRIYDSSYTAPDGTKWRPIT